MFQDTLVSPSILSADFMRLGEEVDAITSAGADWIHFDVIDGLFAPNITVGVPVLKSMMRSARLPVDAHLMVSDPLDKLPWFLAMKPDYVTIHWEALTPGDQEREARLAAGLIREAGSHPGIAIKPDTDPLAIQSTLSLWDMVLVMSVFPGFSGQSYIPESAERVRCAVDACRAAGCSPLIQVDGGIDATTAPLVAEAGADVLVAGNAVFGADDYGQAISAMRHAADTAHAKRDDR